ncbi:DUF6879 family protein [Saccharopolyspora spinosa]|uniref:DUF6879 domain-containing protein n=1 Tax=Saccharopolyspora spinosa TaxID=60894 RepID=A0A2N3Y7L5_SACSN|nr:DUF6879 family protein [Saccharopolyspora spinosa]PKW18900.1 hypothetical protein A8926_7038 [Saccharopolyspora spinosa]
MTELVTGDDFAELFATFERTAWRWEAQPSYAEEYELGPLEAWRTGQPDDLEWMGDWLDDIRAATTAGKLFGRVRVFSDPPTDWQRWQIDRVMRANLDAGEDIRVLDARRAAALELPEQDFWIFDDRKVAVMHFDAATLAFTGAGIVTASEQVARYRRWQVRACDHALTLDDYLSTTPPGST